jgi:hypothetical protein
MILCQIPIPLQFEKERMMSNTYCMRPAGHQGKCSPNPQPEDKPKEVA